MANEGSGPWFPEWSVPPGELLVEALGDRGMTQAELARRMARPLKTINEIANGKAAITAETAIQLERAIGISATYWNGLEVRYREALARADAARALEAEAAWLDNFPIAAMVQRGMLVEGRTRAGTLDNLLRLFGVSSPRGWEHQWKRPAAALRSARAYESSPYAVAAWLRWGEIKAADLDRAAYSEGSVAAAVLNLRRLTRLGSFDLAIRRAQRLLADAGVAFVVIDELPGTRASGAARWIAGEPLIQVSLRYRTDDQFWFSVLHECGHIIKGDRRTPYVEDLDPYARNQSPEESAADDFARNSLIPEADYTRFRAAGQPTAETVRRLADEVGVSPGIVVGRLQHDRAIAPSRLNHLKRRYERA